MTLTIDQLWVTVSAGLIFLMQAGFLCLESGLTRQKNSINVAMKNIADISLATLIFWAVGFGIAFGQSSNGLIGGTSFFLNFSTAEKETVLIFLFQAMFCGTAVTIISGAVAERLKFSSYLIITFIVSLLVYPVIAHWVWGGSIDGVRGWLAHIGFIDFAGSTVVHSMGGAAALALLIIIGPRANRFNKDGSPAKIQPSSLPLSMLGVLILWFGWIGFNGGSVMAFNDTVLVAIVNTLMAASSGLVVSLLVERYVVEYYSPMSTINGVLAGLVAITASCNLVSTVDAVIIGAIGACVANTIDRLLLRVKIDDAVSAVPVHLGAGIWGTIAVGIFVPVDTLSSGLSTASQIGVQCLGVLVCGLWAFGISYFIFSVINHYWPLRAKFQWEEQGLNVSEHKATSELLNLVNVMDQQSKTNDLSLRASVDTFTETGQIASFYNRALDSLENASRELMNSKKRYEAISNHSPIGIFSIDTKGNCLFVNDTWGEIFNTDRSHCIEGNWLEYPASTDATSLWKEWAEELITGTPLKDEYSFIDKNNETHYIFVNAVPESDESGQLLGYLGTANDITERKNLQTQLNQAQKMESIGQLTAGVAHELNSPLQFVDSNTQFIQDSFKDLLALQVMYTQLIADMREGKSTDTLLEEISALCKDYDIDYLTTEIPVAIEQTIDGVSRVSNIIRAMKDFSHPSKNELSFVDLNLAIENIIIMSGNEWKPVAELRKDLDDSLPQVCCIESEISQAVLVLIVNAAQAIEEKQKKEAKINVETEAEAEKGTICVSTKNIGEFVEIRVTDTGSGIPESIKDKVFDPFFTTKEVGTGSSGQGLSIAYNIIVNNHKGSVEIESEENEGTTVILKITKSVLDVQNQA